MLYTHGKVAVSPSFTQIPAGSLYYIEEAISSEDESELLKYLHVLLGKRKYVGCDALHLMILITCINRNDLF